MKWFQKLLVLFPGIAAALCCTLSPSAASTAAAAASQQKAWPNRAVEMSIVFSPGGALDIMARALAQEAETLLGQPVTPTNTPGGGGVPGVARIARAAADGYHLAACVSNALIFLPHRNITPYKPLADFEPILSFGQAAPVLVTTPNAPWASPESDFQSSLDSFFAATREKKGAMRVGVPGLGSPSHIVLSMISKHDPGLTWRFVPFGGPGEAEAALLGGHVDAAVSGALPRIKGGQLSPLMALAAERLPALPNVPALGDKGFSDPGRGDSTFVLLAPAGTPEAVLNTLEAAFIKAADSDSFRKTMERFSVAPIVRGRAETKAFLRDMWNEETKILAAAGLGDKPATPPE